MTKFKVGDKVRILRTGYKWCGLDSGTVHSVARISDGLAHLKGVYDGGECRYYCFIDQELELVSDHTIKVGGKYTSKNGREWECVAVRGDTAWMAATFNDGPYGSAYVFKTDGTNISQGGGEWDIEFPPHEEWIDTRFSVSTADPDASDGSANHVARIRFKLVDGKADWSTATVTG